MPVMDGIQATRHITGAGSSKVLILTMFDLDGYVYEALRVGAIGFMLKDSPKEELVAAIEVVARGERVTCKQPAVRATKGPLRLPKNISSHPNGPRPVRWFRARPPSRTCRF